MANLARPAVGAWIALAAQIAYAATPIITGTMCGWDAAAIRPGCATGKFDRSYHYADDRPVHIFKPDHGSRVKNRLVVFLHAGGAPPSRAAVTGSGNLDGDGFLSAATRAGYHAISLDYFADDQHPAPGGEARSRCACDPDCYGYLYDQLWRGTAHPGLPAMAAEESIEHRLVKVLEWLVGHDPNNNWAQFLVGKGGAATPNYAAMVLSGHSLGANIVSYIGRNVRVARVIMLAGAGDSLDFDPQYGKIDQSGQHYSYQDSTNTKCERKLQTPSWVRDNHFGRNRGTEWKTPLAAFYGIRAACDSVLFNPDLAAISPFNPYIESTLQDWDALALDSFGAYEELGAPDGLRAHGLFFGRRDRAAPPYACLPRSLCGGEHASMLGGLVTGPSGGYCATPAEVAVLRAAWDYVLTNP